MRSNPLPITCLAVVLILSVLFAPAHALSLLPLSFDQLKAQAESVVLARVHSVSSEATDEPGMRGVQTRIRLERHTTLSGNAPAEFFDVVTAGGSIARRSVAVPGVPAFEPGEQVALFLRKLDAAGEYGLVGHGLGVYRIAANNSVKPDVAAENGPALKGEAWSAFTARFIQHGPVITALPLEHRATSNSDDSLWMRLLIVALAALLLLVGVLLRRRQHKAALLLALSTGLAAVLALPAPSHAAPAGSRAFALSGPKWDLSKTTRGRVAGGRVLWVQGTGTSDIDGDQEFSIITQRFQQWEDLPDSVIAFRQDGINIESGNGVDERNTISFQLKVPRKVFDLQTLAITFIVFEDNVMIDTDIVFNDQDVTWMPQGGPFSLDVVALHEVGHLLGLDHTSEPSDVMFPTARGVTLFSAGDQQGCAALYPLSPAQPPVAIISASPSVGAAPLNVSFSSTPSVSRVAEALSVSWDFGDGSAPSTEAAPAHVYAAAGTYTAALTVTDSAGSNTTTAVIVVGTGGKALSVSKFQFKSELVTPLRATKSKDSFSITLAGTDVLSGDSFSLLIGVIRIEAAGGAISLDSRGQFKSDLGGSGKLTAKTNAKSGELTITLSSAPLGIAFDPRGPNDTAQSGAASFPVTLLIQRGEQKIVQTADASFFFTVKTGNTPGGFLEKSISGKK